MFEIKFRIIQIETRLKIVYGSLKNMSIGEIGARGDTKCQKFDRFSEER